VKLASYPLAIVVFFLYGCAEINSKEENKTMSELVDRINLLAEKASVLKDRNLFITLDIENALVQAKTLDASVEPKGLLHGVPVVVKDNIHVAGMPNTAGTPGLLGFVPEEDNGAIACLRAAGAVFVGKTNMHELAAGITSNNAHFGAVGNAYEPGFIAGGSSGGTASAIASGLVDMGLGTDTGGSVRIPAALNGIVGFRPSTGRYASAGVTPLSQTRDVIGPLAKDLKSIVLLDELMTCHSGNDESSLESLKPKNIRLGVPRAYFYENLDPETRVLMEQALAVLSDAGITLVEADIENVGTLLEKTTFPIVLFEAKRDLIRYLNTYIPQVSFAELVESIASPDVKGLFTSLLDAGIPEADYMDAMKVREEFRVVYANYFSEHQLDAVVFPTTPLPARPIIGSDKTVRLNGEDVATFNAYIRNTEMATIVAAPALSLPIGFTPGHLPVGLEIDGLENQDRALLQIGSVLEKLLSPSQ